MSADFLTTLETPQVHSRAVCNGCRRYHDIRCAPEQMIHQMASWEYKHSRAGCDIAFLKLKHRIPRGWDHTSTGKRLNRLICEFREWLLPWWLRTSEFRENANFQWSFNASSNLTWTSLNSLASDTNLLAGASSAVVDNGASATLLEIGLTGFIKAGSSPTANKEIDTWAWSTIDDTPTYPDAISGNDATISMTSTNVLNNALSPVCSFTNDSTASRVYYRSALSLSAIFGGLMPRKWGLWAVHNTGVALASSGHQWTAKQSYVAA
jgi:hypothetical protein